MRISWGVGITAMYIVFALATSGFVAFAMSRPVSLVSPDYYAESLREDLHLAAIRNARGLGKAVAVTYNGVDRIQLVVPASHARAAQGSVTLYRPSDAAADRTLPLTPSATGDQNVDVRGLARGLWIVQLRWSLDAKEYYVEQPVVLK
jgi:hypothetical protein